MSSGQWKLTKHDEPKEGGVCVRVCFSTQILSTWEFILDIVPGSDFLNTPLLPVWPWG